MNMNSAVDFYLSVYLSNENNRNYEHEPNKINDGTILVLAHVQFI